MKMIRKIKRYFERKKLYRQMIEQMLDNQQAIMNYCFAESRFSRMYRYSILSDRLNESILATEAIRKQYINLVLLKK